MLDEAFDAFFDFVRVRLEPLGQHVGHFYHAFVILHRFAMIHDAHDHRFDHWSSVVVNVRLFLILFTVSVSLHALTTFRRTRLLLLTKSSLNRNRSYGFILAAAATAHPVFDGPPIVCAPPLFTLVVVVVVVASLFIPAIADDDDDAVADDEASFRFNTLFLVMDRFCR